MGNKASKNSGPQGERKVALVVTKQSGDFPIYEDEYQRWDKTISDLSKKYGVPANLIHSMMAQESEYGRSKRAGNNVLQMTSPAYAEINDAYARKKYGWADSPKNSLQLQTPEQGAEAGVRYMVVMRDRYGIDLNDAYKTGRRFNGSAQKDAYGRNIATMVDQFGNYQKTLPTPTAQAEVIPAISDRTLPAINRVVMNNVKTSPIINEAIPNIQVDWV